MPNDDEKQPQENPAQEKHTQEKPVPEKPEYIRPRGAVVILYRGMLQFADEKGILTDLPTEFVESLKNMNVDCKKGMDGNILAETMYWVIQETPVRELAGTLSGWLKKNFEIKLKR
jgi:hypothetical protein